MRRTALLFGAPYGSLRHVEASLARLRVTLERDRFAVIVHPEAPRELLLGELDRWIDGLSPGDAAVLVYVGHGGHRAGIGHLQPSGYPGPGGDFRGVLALELGQRLVRLARRTKNATLVLDCCHASGVVEDPGHLEANELQRLIEAQARRLSPRGALELAPPPEPALDSIVQLAAATTSQTAMEDRDQGVGLFSGHLADVLDHCRGLTVSWRELLAEVRLRVTATEPAQSPVLGGPSQRIPFTERDAPLRIYDFACRRGGEALYAAAGELDGLAIGDRFRVRRLGSEAADDAPLAVVTEVGLQHARLRLAQGVAPDGPLRIVRTQTNGGLARDGWSLVHAASAAPGSLSPDSYDLRWGRVDDSGRSGPPLPAVAAVLRPDDDIWLAFGTRENRRASRLHFAPFHVDPSGHMRPLCPGWTHGVPLTIGRHHLVASRLAGRLPRADTLAWPKGLSPGEHALVVVVCDGPIFLRTLPAGGLESGCAVPAPLYALHSIRFTVVPAASAPTRGAVRAAAKK
jgi:hypothetical protein